MESLVLEYVVPMKLFFFLTEVHCILGITFHIAYSTTITWFCIVLLDIVSKRKFSLLRIAKRLAGYFFTLPSMIAWSLHSHLG